MTNRGRRLLLAGCVLCWNGLPARSAEPAEGPSRVLAEVRVALRASETTGSDLPIRRIGLDEALEIAGRDNVRLALAEAAEREARAGAAEDLGRVLPALQLGGRYQRRDGRIQASFGELGDRAYSTYESQIGLAYSANLGARVHDRIAGRRRMDAAVLRHLDETQRVTLHVAELYHDLVLARVGVDTAATLADGGAEFLAVARARETTGVGSGADVARAQAKLASDREEIVLARRVWEATSVTLATVLRLDPGVLLDPDAESLAPWRLSAPDESAEPRPDVAASGLAVQASRHLRSAARWDLFSPKLMAGAWRFELGDHASGLEPRDEHEVALLWTISLDRGAAIRTRAAELDAARWRLAEIEDRARAEVANARRDVEAARDRIPLARDGLSAAEDNLRIARARFKLGTAIALELFDAEDTLARARLGLAGAIADYNVAQVRLLAATGRLTPELLSQNAREAAAW